MAAAEDVKDRLRRAAAALEAGGIPYAVVGGNAVAEWVGSVDRAAVRTTRDVDILLRRSDLEAAKVAMAAAGFVYRHAASVDMFLDGEDAKARDAVHIVFASEKVRPDALAASPDVADGQLSAGGFQVMGLHELITMKLTSYRLKDRVHLQDMVSVGLIDATWPAKFPAALGDRLQAILDDPEG
ncbi:MAG TPA: nucleotidyltransferase family protein [Gemmataceae bacterium]|nr:nucleotidyltransferase family protein [Gemmataceae bacterium]